LSLKLTKQLGAALIENFSTPANTNDQQSRAEPNPDN
jgi:hypothetical protein